jgi:hypothetical protein
VGSYSVVSVRSDENTDPSDPLADPSEIDSPR